jgi:phosphoserine phosphatase RsbU/P
MANQIEQMFSNQLQERKERLQEAALHVENPSEFDQLLRDVDSALEKIASGMYGLCETCHEPIEPERLAVDPLIKYCVDHLSESEQRALEKDLELARQIQTGLLPRKDVVLPGWESAYHYEPSAQVSGDYCDIILPRDNSDSFFFIVGDVTGKGIAASMLMSQLHATFRTLAGTGMSLKRLMEQANRTFCEASLTTHFATLVCGLANSSGEVELSNAGHCLPLVVRNDRVDRMPSSGLPLGVTCDGKYGIDKIKLAKGESLLLYTDGLSESVGRTGELYGEERIIGLLTDKHQASPSCLVSACVSDLDSFSGNARRADDLTIMVIRKK